MFPERTEVLVVDDEPSVTDLLSTDLRGQGYSCITAATGEEALKRLSMGNVDVVLLDLRLPGISGMDVLTEIASTYPRTMVIVVTGIGDSQTAVEAMKRGAVDYFTKPFELEKVIGGIETALQKMPAWEKKSALSNSPEASDDEVDWTVHLDAIARGVELRLESLTAGATTKTIVDKTVDVARDLDISKDQIKKWADATLEQNAERMKVMDSLLKKLERNPIAQIVLGMTDAHQCPPGHESRLN